MSTTSTIYVKVRKEDKGKTLKCDLSKVILNLDNAFKIKKEEIERKITPITLDKDYIRIYVHRNGIHRNPDRGTVQRDQGSRGRTQDIRGQRPSVFVECLH